MSYLERKRNAIMSVTDTVRGYLRTASGEPPLTLTDTYPDKLKVKLYGKSTQPTGTYYTADHTITEAECNYTTRKIWFNGYHDGYTGNFYVYDGFAYWCFALVDDCTSANYYIDCLRLSIFDETGDVDQEIEVFDSPTIPAGYTNFALTVNGDLNQRTGNVYLFGTTTSSLGTVNGKYANFMPGINLVSGTKLLYDSYSPSLNFLYKEFHFNNGFYIYEGNYYIQDGGDYYLFTTDGYQSFFECVINSVSLYFYDGLMPTYRVEKADSAPAGYTNLTSQLSSTQVYNSAITFTESETATGTILTAENVTSNTYPDTVHPQTITSPTAGGTVRGKNLFDPSLWSTPITTSGVTVQYIANEDCFLLNGTATSTTILSDKYINIPIISGSYFSISTRYVSGTVTRPTGTEYAFAYFGANDIINAVINWAAANLNNVDAFSVNSKCEYNYITRFWFYVAAGVVFDNYKVKIQLEKNPIATAYEPYQSTDITITKDGQPVSLYGLPVSSGGNVTIGGQQYLSDMLTDNGDGTGTVERNTGRIASYDDETITTDYLSTTGGLDTGDEIVYLLGTPTTEPVTITKNKAQNGTTIIISDCPYIGAEYYSWEES